MRWLLWLTGLLLLLWCGAWLAGRTLILRELPVLAAQAEAKGATASYDAVSIGGFPSRLDATITQPRYLDRHGRFGWQAQVLRAQVMTWKPWHIILNLPDAQQLTLEGLPWQITGQGLQASLRAAPALSLPLAEARLNGKAVSLNTPLSQQLGAEAVTVAIRASDKAKTEVTGAGVTGQTADGQGYPYDLGADLTGISLDPSWILAIHDAKLAGAPTTPLPDLIDRLHLDATLNLTAPLDRHADQTDPRPISVTLRDFSLVWGPLSLVANGQLQPDANGFAQGQIALTATNWEYLPGLLVAGGVMRAQQAPLIGNMLRALATEVDGTSRLTVTLEMAAGQMRFGPFPLGPAPRLGQ